MLGTDESRKAGSPGRRCTECEGQGQAQLRRRNGILRRAGIPGFSYGTRRRTFLGWHKLRPEAVGSKGR